MASDVLGADSSTWRTLRTLLTRPGGLTVEYLAGHRRRFLPPLRVYLLASVPFLALAGSTPAGQSMSQVQPAAVYAALLRRTRATFTRHLVFTLHLHAFGFVTASLAQAVWYLPPHLLGRILAGAFALAPVVYLPFAIRRTYGTSWWRSLATVVGAVVVDALLLAPSAAAALQLTNRMMS